MCHGHSSINTEQASNFTLSTVNGLSIGYKADQEVVVVLATLRFPYEE